MFFRDKYFTWLLKNNQFDKAAAMIETESTLKAIRLYLDAGRPLQAARLFLNDTTIFEDKEIKNEILQALQKNDLSEIAGDILEKSGNYLNAITAYSKADCFSRALDVARKFEPNLVVDLEKNWGNYLVYTGHFDAAINHFIEAGETLLALNASINAHQWRKALQIIKVNYYSSNLKYNGIL